MRIGPLACIVLLLLLLAACHAQPPQASLDIPLPPNAKELPIGDPSTYQARIDPVWNELQMRLRPTFGTVQTQQYAIPAAMSWEEVQEFYRGAFTDLNIDPKLSGRAEYYKTIVLDSPNHTKFVAITLLDPPGADGASRILLISSAYR